MNAISLHSALIVLAGGAASADLLVHENFEYPVGDLSGNSGGSGWTTGWTDTGNSVVVRSAGLAFTDGIGNTLVTSGASLDTADGGAATTISAREIADRNAETWISVLIQPQGNFSDFIGVSFYDQGLATANARFAIEQNGKDLRLTRRAGTTTPIHTTTFVNPSGSTALAVLHLVPGGGGTVELPDRIDVFFNPALGAEPTVPHASVDLNGLQFDRIRVAAQNGKSTWVDEIRIGESYADVTPFIPAVDPDTDGDGLTDAQEATLGLDPNVSDAAFIAALRANPGLAGVHSTDEIAEVDAGGLVIESTGPATFEYSLLIRKKHGTILETITRPLAPPPARQFLRLHLDTP
jgi:hypothetical protein